MGSTQHAQHTGGNHDAPAPRTEVAEADPLAGYTPVDMASAPPAVRPCTMAAALDLIGERWSLLALREIGYGVHRFARIVAFTGASRDILADRLRKLEAAGIVERRRYSEHPPRHEYHLTQAGRELFPVTISLLTWGEKWAVDSPAVLFRHSCGQRVAIELSCGHCGEPVTRDSLTPVRPATGLPAGPAQD
jgi:DNA-binding HxlR family transcriptional regulator